MKSPYVYDKAKYHSESVEQHGLSEEHAANHTVVFLRWLIENGLMSESFHKESEGKVEQFLVGKVSIHEIYNWWDGCLIDDMLSREGNRFAKHYFDFEKGKYLADYIGQLQGDLPSEFHIDYAEENYREMKKIIDRRYKQWKTKKKR